MIRAPDLLVENARKLLRTFPQLEPSIETGYNVYARNYIRLYATIHCQRSQRSRTFPKVLVVDPSTIHEVIKPGFHRHPDLICEVMDGDWDRNTLRFEGLTSYTSIKNHFQYGVAWEDTEFYQVMLAKVEQGIEWQNCTSRQDIEDRFQRIDELYGSMEKNGYKTQFEISTENGAQSGTDRYPLQKEVASEEQLLTNEVIVDIGRDGQLIFEDGRHRLSIAKLLGIDRIPVMVLVRHHQYVDHRVGGDDQ